MQYLFGILVSCLFITLFSCQSDPAPKPVTKEELNELANNMYDTTSFRLKTEQAQEFVDKTISYVEKNPEQTSNVLRLLRAGETARSMRDFQKALAIYDKVYVNYPDHPKAPQALFLKAFTLDNDLKKPNQARAAYQEFLEKHPNDDFADDTQFLLENLGKSDEEILKNWNGEEPKEEQVNE